MVLLKETDIIEKDIHHQHLLVHNHSQEDILEMHVHQLSSKQERNISENWLFFHAV